MSYYIIVLLRCSFPARYNIDYFLVLGYMYDFQESSETPVYQTAPVMWGESVLVLGVFVCWWALVRVTSQTVPPAAAAAAAIEVQPTLLFGTNTFFNPHFLQFPKIDPLESI